MKKYWKFIIIIWVIIVAINAAAFLIPGFSDWYIDHITPLWVGSYGRLSGIFSFSVGEIMLTISVALILITAIGTLLFIFILRIRPFMKWLYKTDLCIITCVCLLMSLNCTVLYRGSSMASENQYTISNLYELKKFIVGKCNEYSLLISRDENGYATYSGDMQEEAKNALQGISDKYPRLSGYYPNVKPMLYSALMSQMYMTGYYFPFSMEANANSLAYIVNTPAVYCHELSHLHGYIFEDEANFLAFVACTESSDVFFIYSGYMSVLNYVENAFAQYEDGFEDVKTNEYVNKDNIFLTSQMWAAVEETAILSTETVSEASTAFTDSTLKLNGVEDGIASYSRVVSLLLDYYNGVLY